MSSSKSILVGMLFLFVMFYTFESRAQIEISVDTTVNTALNTLPKVIDTTFLQFNNQLSNAESWISGGSKKTKADFELLRPHQTSLIVFVWIIIALLLFAIVRLLYKRELQELIQSLINKQLAGQINRTKTSSINNFSIILILIAVVNISILTMYSLMYFYGEINHDTIQFFIKLIFLFTFFLVSKIAVVKLLGLLFDEEEEAETYINDLLMILKVLGIAVFPVLLMIYVAIQKDWKFFVYAFTVVVVVHLLVLIWRGLSTSVQMMYKSMYHFLLYVCTVEVLSVFLLIKLLTKIAS